MTGIQYGTRLI